MKYVSIKCIGEPISRLFIGSAWIAPEDEKTVFSIFDRYFELGGSVIDTGRFYGKGGGVAGAERTVAAWMRRSGLRRGDMHILNKCCHPFITKDGVMHDERWRVSPEFITEDLVYSLDDMGLDYFDIYEMHRDDKRVPVGELMDTLEEHRKHGLIRAYGVSNWEIPRIAEAMAYCSERGYPGPSTSNPSYSLATVRAERWKGCVFADDAFARWHADKDITLLSWAAQAAGFFAGAFDGGYDPAHAHEAFYTAENLEKRRRAGELANTYGVSATNIALAYVFNQGFPVCASVGPTDVRQTEECVTASGLTLSPAEVEYLSLRRETL